MSQLPEGWVSCKLGDVVDYGQTVKADMTNIDESTWVLELEDLEKDSSKILQRVSFGERKPKSAKNSFEAGDILYGKLRPYLNKMVVAPEEGICTSEIIPLKVPTGMLNNRFLFYWLKSRVFGDYVNAVSYGVNMPRLGTKDGLNAPMALAPTAEQTRIVAKLDEVLAQVDTIKACLDGIPTILKRFRQSLLATAVSGRLTKEWRGSKSIHEPLRKKLGDVITKIGQGWSPKCENTPAENHVWGVIKTSSVQNISFWEHENKALPTSLEPRPEHEIFAGDILITRAGPRVRCGVTAFVESTRAKLMICDKVYRFRVKEAEGYSKYLVYLLNAPQCLAEIEKMKTGISDSGMNLTQSKFKQFSLLWPHKEEQAEIIRLIDQYFAFADTIEVQVKKAQTRVDKLTQAILAKAFRGELTADWRAANPELISGDNSAAALLTRIQAERAAAKPRKSRRG